MTYTLLDISVIFQFISAIKYSLLVSLVLNKLTNYGRRHLNNSPTVMFCGTPCLLNFILNLVLALLKIIVFIQFFDQETWLIRFHREILIPWEDRKLIFSNKRGCKHNFNWLSMQDGNARFTMVLLQPLSDQKSRRYRRSSESDSKSFNLTLILY